MKCCGKSPEELFKGIKIEANEFFPKDEIVIHAPNYSQPPTIIPTGIDEKGRSSFIKFFGRFFTIKGVKNE